MGGVFLVLGFFHSLVYPSVIFFFFLIVLQHPLLQGMFNKILQEVVGSLRGIRLLITLQDLESKKKVVCRRRSSFTVTFWQIY